MTVQNRRPNARLESLQAVSAKGSISGVAVDARGAVMVEFLIAYLPVLVAFLMFWQLGELLIAQMVVERASSAAGRAAVVVLPDDPAFYDAQDKGVYDGERKREIRLAAGMILAASPHLSENFTVDVRDIPPNGDAAEEIGVDVEAEFRCRRLKWVCGANGITILRSSSQHTYQGAGYDYEPTDLSNVGQTNASTAADPGCSDQSTPGAPGKNSGPNGSGNKGGPPVPGKGGSFGSGGKGNTSADPSGSCPPGQSALKDGSCGKDKGGADGSCVSGYVECATGCCPTGKGSGGSGGGSNKGGNGGTGGRGGNDDGAGGNGGNGGSGGCKNASNGSDSCVSCDLGNERPRKGNNDCEANLSNADCAKFKKDMCTDKNGAVFWTGGAMNDANAWAKKKQSGMGAGSTVSTLEDRLRATKWLQPKAWNCANSAYWNDASKFLAQCATGTSYVVTGNTIRPGNVFETVEIQQLTDGSSKVDKLVRVDPATGAEKVIWKKGDPPVKPGDCTASPPRHPACSAYKSP